MYECERIIKHCKPKYLLLENVKNLVGKKNKPQFDEWLKFLEGLGYTNYWKILNAKDYGVPQNRERVFVVSILGEHKPYEFPTSISLDKTIKDVLEGEVDEKYYLSDDKVKKMKARLSGSTGVQRVGNVNPSGNGMNGNVFSYTGISPTLTTNKGEGIKILLPLICASRGRCVDNPTSRVSGLPTEQIIEINTKGVSNTLTTVQKDNYVIEKNYRVRKLTPLECWRLMAFTDKDFFKAKNVGISNSQLYKQAGNSIVVKVLEGIFKELFLSEKENNERDFEIVKLGNTKVEQFKWVI